MILEIELPYDFTNHFEKTFTYNQEFISNELFTSHIQETSIETDTSLSNFPQYKAYSHTLDNNHHFRYL